MSQFHKQNDYIEYWSLDAAPFLHHDPNRFFSGSAQRAALAQVDQFVSSGERFATVKSELGYGTTRLLQHLSLHAGMGDNAIEMVLGPRAPIADPNVRTLWLVDRDQIDLPSIGNAITSVSVIAAIDSPMHRRMTAKLGRFPRTIELAEISLDDAFDYVAFAIRMAGGKKMIFTDDAVAQLHKLSAGRIREFARMAENALWESCSCRQKMIGHSAINRLSDLFRRAA